MDQVSPFADQARSSANQASLCVLRRGRTTSSVMAISGISYQEVGLHRGNLRDTSPGRQSMRQSDRDAQSLISVDFACNHRRRWSTVAAPGLLHRLHRLMANGLGVRSVDHYHCQVTAPPQCEGYLEGAEGQVVYRCHSRELRRRFRLCLSMALWREMRTTYVVLQSQGMRRIHQAKEQSVPKAHLEHLCLQG